MAGIPAQIYNRGAGRDGDGDIGTVFSPKRLAPSLGYGLFYHGCLAAG